MGSVSRAERETAHGHRAAIVWLTGLSGSGKSTLAYALERRLHDLGCRAFVLDGDSVRQGLCGDLGFSIAARRENIRRASEVARLFFEAGTIVLVAFISPLEDDRKIARSLVSPDDFLEVYCQAPIEVCEARDVKGLYRRARAGELSEFTGISSPYEVPRTPELVVDTARASIDECLSSMLELLRQRGVVDQPG